MGTLLYKLISPVERLVRWCVLKPLWGKQYDKMKHHRAGIQAGPPWYGCRD